MKFIYIHDLEEQQIKDISTAYGKDFRVLNDGIIGISIEINDLYLGLFSKGATNELDEKVSGESRVNDCASCFKVCVGCRE
jgi:hypothetical protein